MRALVHGDDFVPVGKKKMLDKLQAHLEGEYECKVQRLGWTRGMSREARIFGRIITLTDDGAMIEADPALLEK